MIPIIVLNIILIVIAILLLIAEKYLVTYGECKISVNKEKTLNVTGGDNLLNYFAQHKIFIPSACGGKATCGYCKIEVLSGGGHILPTEETFIGRQEKQRGVRLACQVKVKNDIEVLISPDLLSAQEFKVTVTRIDDLTQDIKHLFLKLDEPAEIKFKPGQYVQFKVPETDVFRAYSVASAPSKNDMIELVVRLVPGGLCSSYVHEVLDVNDQIVITGPFGDFYLREDSSRNIVCIAGGCGMAPIRSILKYMSELNVPRKINYFFGARSKSDLFFTDELYSLEKQYSFFKYTPVLSEPKPHDNWRGETGFVTQAVERILQHDDNTEAYLCGPPPMIDAAVRVLTQKGIKEIHIYYDKF